MIKYQTIVHFRGLKVGCLVKGWALIRGVGAYLRGRLLDNLVSRVGAYLRLGAYLRVALNLSITVDESSNPRGVDAFYGMKISSRMRKILPFEFLDLYTFLW